jgi:unsaturated chondroitin disaccharide hydrolase
MSEIMKTTKSILIQTSLELALNKVTANYDSYGLEFPTRGYPTYSTSPNDHWVAGFWPGILWLTYSVTRAPELRAKAEELLPSFVERLENRIDLSHDLGFLYTLSTCAAWQLTDNQQARDIGVRAAQELGKRFNQNGKYIQAWGDIGEEPEAGRMIIDCMMNLPLLYWASEVTGNTTYRDIAQHHAVSTRKYLVRQDGSTYHTFFLNPKTGQQVGGKTSQGHDDESLWSRGQAWGIYGFALTAQWLGSAVFLEVAEELADRFFAESPIDCTPLWDLRLPPGAPKYLDSSAGAIAACGLLRLAHLTNRTDYRQQAEILINVLCAECFESDTNQQGLLKFGAQHVPEGIADEYLIYGDYFFLEALLTLNGQAPDFWGPSKKS